MSYGFLIAAAIVAVSSLGIFVIEAARSRFRAFDTFSVFLVIYLLQVLAPSGVIFLILAFRGIEGVQVGNPFFDRVYNAASASDALIMGAFSTIFLALAFIVFRAMCGASMARIRPAKLTLRIAPWRLRGLVAIGIALDLVLVFSLSSDGSIIDGYRNLIRFRTLAPEIERTALTANLFALTQTFLLLGFLGLFLPSRGRFRGLRFLFWCGVVILLGLACASRRSILIPPILFLFACLLAGRVARVWHVALLGAIGGVVIFGGKQALSHIGGQTSTFIVPVRSPAENMLYLASDIGISSVESLGTIALAEMPPRVGVDHALSIARRVPEGALGFEDPFPARIVRYTTEIFVDADAADVPPGFIGMMWLDFRWFGPAIYGVACGLLLGLLERVRRLFVIDLQASAIFAVILFVALLPINTGSLDYSFSVDIIALTILLPSVICIIRLRSETGSMDGRGHDSGRDGGSGVTHPLRVTE